MVRKLNKTSVELDPSLMLGDALLKIKKENLESGGKPLSIIDFSKEILDPKGQSLFPAQEVILKFFYAGTKFNEDLRITEEDIEEIKSWDIPQPWITDTENNKIYALKENIEKFNEDPANNFFRDLVLVLGRRSGKSFLTALLAVYEAYKLIMLKDPQKYYGIGGEIWIINTAVSGKQAETIIFSQILDFVNQCAIFDGRVFKQLDDTLYICTDEDLKKREKAKKHGLKQTNGSIVLASGNSNSGALRGHAAACFHKDTIIFTENGMERIGNILKKENEGIFDIDIKCYDGKEFQKSSKLSVSRKDIYEIVLDNNKKVKSTRDHVFFIYDMKEDKVLEKKLIDIRDEDLIIVNKENDIFSKNNFYFGEEYKKFLLHYYNCENGVKDSYIKMPNKMTEDLAHILGCLISEGRYSTKTNISFGSIDLDVVEKYAEKVYNVFGIKQKIEIIEPKTTKHKKYYYYQFHYDKIKYFLSKVVGLGNKIHNEKTIPDCILMSKKETIKSFLRSLFDGDGTFSKKEVSYSSTSKSLIDDLSVVFDNFGYSYYIVESKNKNKNSKKCYKLLLYNEDAINFIETIGFVSKRRNLKIKDFLKKHKNQNKQKRNVKISLKRLENIKESLSKINLEKKDKRIKNNFYSAICSIKSFKKRQKNISREKVKEILYLNNKYNFIEKEDLEYLDFIGSCELNYIKKINYYKKDFVYDIQVENSHKFIANGFLVHNCIIYDEMAHFVDTGGKASGEETYTALKYSVLTFQQKGDGRNITISSPDAASGFFFHHYESRKHANSALVFQIPTWNANPTITRESLNDAFEQNPDRASAELGAEFRRSGGNIFIPEEMILEAQHKRNGWYRKQEGVPGTEYYLHIDPAKNSDRWAIIIAHEEQRIDVETRQFVRYVVEDYSKAINPEGETLNPDKIMDDVIIPLFSKFNIISVSCDTFFSTEQQIKLQKKGIAPREISYSGANKNKLYTNMKDYFIRGTIELCNDDQDLVEELRRITIDYSKKIPKIENPGNDKFCPWDDLPDCLCGIIDSMIKGASGATRLPRSGLVRTRM